MIRLVAAGLVLAGALSALKGCPAEGDPGGVNNGPAGPAAGKVVRPISVLVSWKKGFWMDITVIIDGEARGPFESASGGWQRTWDVAPGKRVEVYARHHKDMDPPPGATACLLKWFNTTLMPGGYDHRQDGSCHAWGDVPNVETQG